jgi:intein/homing endonuclease
MDSFSKNQFLGLFFADGCLIKNTNRINITLKEDDKDYLKQMNSYLGCSKPVVLMKKEGVRFFKKDNKSYKTKNAYGISITCKEMRDDLIKWGVEYNKSYTNFSIPDIPRKFLNAFVLGYFEGDGNISFSKIKNRKTISHSFSILCQPKFAQELQNIFKSELNIDSRIYIKKAQPTLRTIQITKINDLIKLYHWLYDDAEIVMVRKHDKFKYILNWFGERNYKIGELRKFE